MLKLCGAKNINENTLFLCVCPFCVAINRKVVVCGSGDIHSFSWFSPGSQRWIRRRGNSAVCGEELSFASQ